MSIAEQLNHTLALIKLERQADLEYYRQKILLLPLHRKTKEGKCWYPVKVLKDYIGTGERLIIEVERKTELDQPHVFGSGKLVSIFSNHRNNLEKDNTGGVINYVRDNKMVITLNADDLPDWFDHGQIGIDVMFDEMTYREMEFVLKIVMQAEGSRLAELRDILLGGQKAKIEYSETPNDTDLNESQQKALVKIANAKDVAIIHGPPGTGKTTTLAHAIHQTVKKEKQVLVCAPSNAAVDWIIEKLADLGLRVLRIGHPARVTEQTLSKTLDAQIANHIHYKELRTMRKKMEQLKTKASKYKRNFGYAEKQQRRLLNQEAKALKADADVLEFHIVNDLLNSTEVIACTLVGASHYVIRGRKFKTVFIDEAGQALEPACWIPVIRAGRVVFAGDHCQLPPTIKSKEAAKGGLETTLFEKAIRHHPAMAEMLTIQYRMHEAIMTFSSNYFYNNELVAHDSVKSSVLQEDIPPVSFIDTAGCGFNEKLDPETLSRNNEEEGDLLLKILENLIGHVGIQSWSASIGIITPYRAQVEYLTKIVENSVMLSELSEFITINTVDAFQGQERDVIAISFVRSNTEGEVGFLSDIRRTNVAMTRAKKKLIMVGDSATLGSHPFYMKLLEFVQEGGFYQSAWEFIN